MKNFTANPLSQSLITRLWSTMTPTPAPERKPPQVVHGPKTRTAKPHSMCKGSDELFLEIRRLHDYHRMGPLKIRNRLGLTMSPDRIAQITMYYTRSHLVPEDRSWPYWKPGQGEEA